VLFAKSLLTVPVDLENRIPVAQGFEHLPQRGFVAVDLLAPFDATRGVEVPREDVDLASPLGMFGFHLRDQLVRPPLGMNVEALASDDRVPRGEMNAHETQACSRRLMLYQRPGMFLGSGKGFVWVAVLAGVLGRKKSPRAFDICGLGIDQDGGIAHAIGREGLQPGGFGGRRHCDAVAHPGCLLEIGGDGIGR
jgi:hypothetical protein